MSLELEARALRSVPMFRNAPAKALELLAFLATVQRFAPGEALMRQGDRGDCAYVLLSGEADVYVGARVEAGDAPEPLSAQRKIAQVAEHQVIGEIAVLCDVQRTATVVATTEVSALRIEADLLLDMARDTPDMALAMMRELAMRLFRTTQALADAQRDLGRRT